MLGADGSLSRINSGGGFQIELNSILGIVTRSRKAATSTGMCVGDGAPVAIIPEQNAKVETIIGNVGDKRPSVCAGQAY